MRGRGDIQAGQRRTWAKASRGRARFANVLRNVLSKRALSAAGSTGGRPPPLLLARLDRTRSAAIFTISRVTNPATRDVVVASAGTIRPAIFCTCFLHRFLFAGVGCRYGRVGDKRCRLVGTRGNGVEGVRRPGDKLIMGYRYTGIRG